MMWAFGRHAEVDRGHAVLEADLGPARHGRRVVEASLVRSSSLIRSSSTPTQASRARSRSAHAGCAAARRGRCGRRPGFGVGVVDAEHPLDDVAHELRVAGAAPARTSTRSGTRRSLRWSRSTNVVVEPAAVAGQAAGARRRRRRSASAAASPAHRPEPMAKLTPSSQMPAARHSAAASPATSSPSPASSGIIVQPRLGDEVGASTPSARPPRRAGRWPDAPSAPAMISSGRRCCAASAGSFSTTPTDERVEVRVEEAAAGHALRAAEDLDVDALAAAHAEALVDHVLAAARASP